MRKIIAIVLCAVTFLSALLSLSACSHEDCPVESGKVLGLEGAGKAYITRAEGTIPMYNGLMIRHGDEITVNGDSAAGFALGNGCFVMAEADSRISIECSDDGRSAVVRIHRGAVYCEMNGVDGNALTVVTGDGRFVAKTADFRVELSEDDVRNFSVSNLHVLKGEVEASLLDGSDKQMTAAGKRSRIERGLTSESDLPFFAARNMDFDMYSLPNRYIGLGEDGVFDANGAIIPAVLSSDISVRDIGFVNADGTKVGLFPQFDSGSPIYTVETDKPFEFFVSVNHRQTALDVQCYGASLVKNGGGQASVRFDPQKEGWSSYVISVFIQAQNGESRRFTVSVVKPG